MFIVFSGLNFRSVHIIIFGKVSYKGLDSVYCFLICVESVVIS